MPWCKVANDMDDEDVDDELDDIDEGFHRGDDGVVGGRCKLW